MTFYVQICTKSHRNEVNIQNCALLVFKSGNIYLDELVYTRYILKFEIPIYKQIIQQKLKLSENHPTVHRYSIATMLQVIASCMHNNFI